MSGPDYLLPQIDYDDSVPSTGHVPAADYSTMQSNATADFNIWDVDHIGFSTPASGYHQQVRMPNFTSNSVGTVPPLVIAGFGGTYCDNTTSTGASTETGLWYSPDASGNKYQLTRSITASISTFGTNTSYSANMTGGWTFLPGGMILQYGSFNPNVTLNVVFPVTFSNIPYSVQLTVSASDNGSYRANIDTGTLSTSGFTFEGTVDSHAKPIYWTAIGV